MFYVFFWVIPRRLSSYLPAYEDGTDRPFRNVGIQNSDAEELPRRKHTTFTSSFFNKIQHSTCYVIGKKYMVNISPTCLCQCGTSTEMVFKILRVNIGPGFVQVISVLYVLKSSAPCPDHKLNNLSEQTVSGASDSSNNLDKTSSLTCVNGCIGYTLLVSSSNTIKTSQNLTTKVPTQAKPSKMKLSYQLNGSVPLNVYHQNIQGLRGRVNELFSRLYQAFSHILCLSEHHKNLLELDQTFFDNYKLGASYYRTLYEKGGVFILCKEV
jgi:hypothetical protein